MSPTNAPLEKASAPPSHREQLRTLRLSEAVSFDLEGGDSFVSALGAVRLDRAEPFSIQHRKVIAASDLKRLGHMGGWKVGPGVDQEVFPWEEYREHARPGDSTRSVILGPRS